MPACYTQRCRQGRQPCPTPWTCSGLKTTCGGESVDLPITMEDEQRPSMLANPWLWVAACVAFGVWFAAVKAGAYWLVP